MCSRDLPGVTRDGRSGVRFKTDNRPRFESAKSLSHVVIKIKINNINDAVFERDQQGHSEKRKSSNIESTQCIERHGSGAESIVSQLGVGSVVFRQLRSVRQLSVELWLRHLSAVAWGRRELVGQSTECIERPGSGAESTVS